MKYYGIQVSHPEDLYYVKCHNCGIYIVMHDIETWNKRAEPSRPQGQWIKKAISEEAVMYECPLCNRVVVDRINNDPSKTYPFCHCGADMRGGKA